MSSGNKNNKISFKKYPSLEYERAMKKFINRFKKNKSWNSSTYLIENFSSIYLIPTELWKYIFPYNCDEILKTGMYHFYFSDYLTQSWNDEIFIKLLNDSNKNEILESVNELIPVTHPSMECIKRYLMYPNCNLNYYFMNYQECLTSPISTQLRLHVEKMQKFYYKIQKVTSIENWMSLLKSSGDHEFVKHNIEHRLGQNLKNKKLWKLYIKYLNKIDSKEMLQVYSKYCRFFLNDFEMIEEYKTQVEIYGDGGCVYVSWKNLFYFETQNALLPEEKIIKSEKNNDWLLPLNFHMISGFPKILIPKMQKWSLPTPIIRYLIDNPKPLVYLKLQQTCKFFFIKNSTLYCCRFLSTDRMKSQTPRFVENSFQMSLTDSITSLIPKSANKRFYITTSLIINHENSDNSLSKLINNFFYRCDAKFIDVQRQLLTEKEYKFLVGHGNVEKLLFNHTDIVKENGVFMILEEVVKELPKARWIDIRNEEIWTHNNLSTTLKFKNKLCHFTVSYLANYLDADDISQFINDNAGESTEFDFNFAAGMNDEIVEEFTEIVERSIAKWIPSKEKPIVTIYIG